jgi:hypothetical protein
MCIAEAGMGTEISPPPDVSLIASGGITIVPDLTAGTNSGKLDAATRDPVAGVLFDLVLTGIEGIEGNVIDPSAFDASNMRMIFQTGIETHLGLTQLNPPDRSRGGQNLQIAIDSAQTDAGELLSNSMIDIVRSGMAVAVLENLKDDLALLRHPRSLFGHHRILPISLFQ